MVSWRRGGGRVAAASQSPLAAAGRPLLLLGGGSPRCRVAGVGGLEAAPIARGPAPHTHLPPGPRRRAASPGPAARAPARGRADRAGRAAARSARGTSRRRRSWGTRPRSPGAPRGRGWGSGSGPGPPPPLLHPPPPSWPRLEAPEAAESAGLRACVRARGESGLAAGTGLRADPGGSRARKKRRHPRCAARPGCPSASQRLWLRPGAARRLDPTIPRTAARSSREAPAGQPGPGWGGPL